MNARTKAELLYSKKTHSAEAYSEQVSLPYQDRERAGEVPRRKPKEENPVIRHLDNLQGQLSQQLDSLTTVMESMQRISNIMDRMAKKNCKLNSGAELVDPNRKRSQ